MYMFRYIIVSSCPLYAKSPCTYKNDSSAIMISYPRVMIHTVDRGHTVDDLKIRSQDKPVCIRLVHIQLLL